MMRELAGVSPGAVLIARSAPANVAAYREVFGVMPQFDAEQYALCFPARLLQTPVRTADPQLRAILEHTVSTFRSIEPPAIAEQVTRLLHARVTVEGTSLRTIAEALGLHPRTLNRRLLEEGTSYVALRDRARLQVAHQLLAGTRLPVTQVALSVGFGEVSSFTRAFRRQSGIAPAMWRRGVRPSAAGAVGRGRPPHPGPLPEGEGAVRHPSPGGLPYRSGRRTG
jgi:AraC-like DNA-binding protein